MKVLVLGASGIVGQHMRLCVPDDVEPIWMRRKADMITRGHDLRKGLPAEMAEADVVVNLAGESNVDVVERDRITHAALNLTLPCLLAMDCRNTGKKFVQVSSQAAYGYPKPADVPVNAYGQQKRAAEQVALDNGGIVVRLTFILGIRPLPHVGRQNPLEAMLAGQSPQVVDRFFSPLFAMDAAELLWQAVLHAQPGEVRELGQPICSTRYDIARMVNPAVKPCSHDDFPGLAPRALDTSYRGSTYMRDISTLPAMVEGYRQSDRAIELALFFGMTSDAAEFKLRRGFKDLHEEVAEDFRRRAPKGNAELLDWYRTTEAYIWELSAYHEDSGFNYAGMVGGIVTHLKNAGVTNVLCLGDGIGDVTLACHRAGLESIYHDLAGSKTAAYAEFRFWRQTGGEMRPETTSTFTPVFAGTYDAVASLDFLEHVVNVEDWVRAVYASLKPGGLFFAQNAFNCGSGENGAIPMHLAVNDRFEKDWDPLLSSVGFTQVSSNWYRKGDA